VHIRKNIVLAGLCLLHSLGSTAQEDTLVQRIVLIADAGQLTHGRHPVVDAVRQHIPLDKKTTVLFMGDNLYKVGLPDEQYKDTYKKARAVLDSQLSVADNTPAKVYMIPGNHDWENGNRGGYDAIIRQQLYVDFLGKPNVKYYPEDGCPGPIEVILGKDSSVAIIMFDSQWWLHPHDKPEIESDCGAKTKEELVSQIADMVTRNSKRLILLACHHPFESNGIHGGFYTPKQHLFPLTDIKKNLYIPMPVIGSIYPIARSVFGSIQDIKHPIYTNMIQEITAVVRANSPNVVFVAGHDHNLQLINKNGYNYIVAGGGCKQSRTSKAKSSLYNSTTTGFSVMEVSSKKNVSVSFYTVTDTSVAKTFNTPSLLNFSKLVDKTDALSEIPIDPLMRYRDTITTSARDDFKKVKGIKKFFMGQNYRNEWLAPVNMKVLHLKTEKGGLKILSLGGGKQTRTLRLLDKDGKEWVLRSMKRTSSKSFTSAQGENTAEYLSMELTTASHPYGALVTPDLLKAIQLGSPRPELFFVPDDPALGIYRQLFANSVCMLEEKDATQDDTKTRTTSKVFSRMLDENDHRPEQAEVLKARLLDMIIGDFDRHFDQWRWSTTDTGKGKTYHPIPRDRDQVFFYSDGFLLKLISKGAMPYLKGFRNNLRNVKWMNYSARDFDRIFLTDLDKKEWTSSIKTIQEELTDSVIRNAVQKLPPAVFTSTGESIIRKLMIRRNLMAEHGMEYYHFVSKKVNVIGSNQKEYFKVTKHEDGIQVRVYARARGNDTGFVMYNRVFHPQETKEIRLFGLHDNDVFEIDEDITRKIRIRIVGGKGQDTFDVRSRINGLLYDQLDDGNVIKQDGNAKNRFSRDAPVNDKSIVGHNYNITKFPQLAIGYNDDDELLVGAGFSRRTYGFRNLPFATDQRFATLYAPGRNAYELQYRGEFNHVFGNVDLIIRGQYASPALRNFFGLGNNTVVNKELGYRFYQTRYKIGEIEALFRKRVGNILQLKAGPYYSFYQNNIADNTNNTLGKFQQLGLDSTAVFGKKSFLGVKAAAAIDNRNNELFPTRGVYWYNQLISVAGLTDGSKGITQFSSDMTVYASQREPAKVIAILRLGGAKLLTKNYDFFQAVTIGPNMGLPGFRKNRYAGSSSLYGGIELRIKLFDINSFILPGPFGITTFYNAARVWHPNDINNKWHGAYGVGFYYNPFNLFSISGSAGFSGKENIVNFTIGTKINLVF
jgi:hypothetical protein